jgi:hypothetical protein
MISHHHPTPALCNLLGYKSAHTQSEAAEMCNLLGYKPAAQSLPPAGSFASARDARPHTVPPGTVPFGAPVCQLLGDMTLEEDDCA